MKKYTSELSCLFRDKPLEANLFRRQEITFFCFGFLLLGAFWGSYSLYIYPMDHSIEQKLSAVVDLDAQLENAIAAGKLQSSSNSFMTKLPGVLDVFTGNLGPEDVFSSLLYEKGKFEVTIANGGRINRKILKAIERKAKYIKPVSRVDKAIYIFEWD